MASITIISGPKQGDYYSLGQRTWVIGRQETCPIQITDDRVSRKHTQVRFEPSDASFRVLDMKSANGTFVNNRRIDTETVLRDNDEIQIGASKLVFSTTDFPDRQSAIDHFKKRGERMRPTIEEQ